MRDLPTPTPDFQAGWNSALANVAAAIDCDIGIWKDELWAIKIIALQEKRKELLEVIKVKNIIIDTLNDTVRRYERERLKEHK